MPPTDERTPLLTIVRVEQRPARYDNQNVRRTCTSLLSAILLIGIIIFLLFLFVIPDCEDLKRHNHRNSKICLSKHPFYRHDHYGDNYVSLQNSDGLGYDELLDLLADTPKEEKVREWSQYYTSGPHLAGKNKSQAEWTRDKWVEFGVSQAEIVSYDVYINYPRGHRLALLEGSAKSKEGEVDVDQKKWKVRYEAGLEEDVLDEDYTSGLKERIPTFHGYSASGNVTASYVFCNYGTFLDFEDLRAAKVSLEGKIALVKYGKIFRGLKIKRAQELGMAGVVIYSDPGDDGDTRDEYGDKYYPDGPARHPSSVQRGSASFLSLGPGDPTTPGYPSKPGCPRQPANFSTPSIPSLPISYKEAVPLLKALNGHGPKAESLGERWKTGGLGYKGIKYNIGPTPDNLRLNLFNDQEYTITPIWNVIGVINGTLSDEVVLLGNHRDAWIAGGAGDPNSGSAALNEVVRSFGLALGKGWKPLRTIVFASWDGEEYGLLGSTEWVEDHLPWLSKTAVVYLNVDAGTRGPQFTVSASPLLNEALIEATQMVFSPNQTKKGQTVYDVWDKEIDTLGSGSDYTAFQDFAGIASVDMGFTYTRASPVYHYHSNYDSFHWMDKFGDPGWHYHTTMARLWNLLTAKLVDSPIIPFNTSVYSHELLGYLKRIEDLAGNSTESVTLDDVVSFNPQLVASVDFSPLSDALHKLNDASAKFDAAAAKLRTKIMENPIPWWKWWEKVRLYYAVRKVNDRYKFLERQFLYAKGYDKRPWYKHIVYAPGIWTGYAGTVFPQLVESIQEGDKQKLKKWIGICTDIVQKAASSLS